MTQKELVNQFCEFRGKLTTDDVVALNFAYKTLVPQGMGRMTKEKFILAVEDWYLTGNEDSITFLGGLFDKVTQPQWISVDEALPKQGISYYSEPVIVTDGTIVGIDMYNHQAGEWDEVKKPTHWIPLPSLPSSSEKPNNSKKGGEG